LSRSGVREPREGDDFGQNFLGVFRVQKYQVLGTTYYDTGFDT
jgi:hypothetical protein